MTTHTQRRLGRRPLPPEQRKSMLLRVRLTTADWRRIYDTSELTGETRAELVRRVVTEETRRVAAVAAKIRKGDCERMAS